MRCCDAQAMARVATCGRAGGPDGTGKTGIATTGCERPSVFDFFSRDSALTSISAQLYLTPKRSFQVKFHGEFASGSELKAGTGMLRSTW